MTGRRCGHVPRARAHEVIAGHLVVNDLSVRRLAAPHADSTASVTSMPVTASGRPARSAIAQAGRGLLPIPSCTMAGMTGTFAFDGHGPTEGEWRRTYRALRR